MKPVLPARIAVSAFAALTALALPPVTDAQTPPIVGGFASVAVNDPGVKAAAAYAISVAPAAPDNKAVRLKSILAARQQVVAGMNYSLCLRVTSAKIALFTHGHLIAAKVFHGLDNHYEVTSWKDVKACD